MRSAGIRRLTDLFNSRFVWVEQGPGFHMFWDEFVPDPWDVLPVLQHSQSQMLICLLLQTWEMKNKQKKMVKGHLLQKHQMLLALGGNQSPFSSSISVGAMKTRFSNFTLPPGP